MMVLRERVMELLLPLVLFLAMCFNVARYGNSKVFVLLAVAGMVLYVYSQASNQRGGMLSTVLIGRRDGSVKKGNDRHREHLKRVVEGFEPSEFLTASFDIHRLPKRFRYVFLRPDAWAPLLSVATLRRLDRATVYKVFATMERFLKVFYNALATETGRKNALETMSQLMEMMRELRTDALTNLPPSIESRRWVNTQFKALETVMAEKSAVLRALVDGKIK